MNHLLTFLLLLPLVAHAQDPTTVQPDGSPFGHTLWASAADSTDFIAFHRAMIMGEETLETTSGDYRAVWRIGEHGGLAMVNRGDGSIWRIEGTSVFGVFMQLPFRMADGRRGFKVVHETPCGLICRDTVYYVEE
jgi:hypothetical protein